MSKEEQNGVWRTIRGRRIFIAKGQLLGEAMAKSGKFNDNGKLPKREDVMKGKKEVKRQEAVRRENEKRPQYKGTDYEVKYYSVADALNDPNSKIRQYIDKKRSNRKNKGK